MQEITRQAAPHTRVTPPAPPAGHRPRRRLALIAVPLGTAAALVATVLALGVSGGTERPATDKEAVNLLNRIATVAAAKNTTQVRDDQYVSTQAQGTQQVKNQGMADPFAGSRTFAAMLVALVIGSAAAGLSALTLADVKAQGENTRRYAELSGQSFVPEGTGFYERAYQLVGYAVLVAMVIAAAGLLVALADGILARRRALASLVATGASHGLLARALSWQVISPVVPAVALATLAGMLLPRLTVPGTNDTADMEVWRCTPMPGDPHDACADAAYQQAHGTLLTAEKVPVTVHMPWGRLALLAGGAVTATVVVTLVGLLFLRMSTRVTELRTS